MLFYLYKNTTVQMFVDKFLKMTYAQQGYIILMKIQKN